MKASLGEVWPFLVLKPSIKASYGSHKAAEYLKKKKKNRDTYQHPQRRLEDIKLPPSESLA